MGNVCSQQVRDNNILMISQKPSKSDYLQSQWPENDQFISNHLLKLNKQKQCPYKHYSKQFYYLGQWRDGMPFGNGLIYCPKKFLFIGLFKDGTPQQKGKYYDISCQFQYQGAFHLGQANGEGILRNNKEKFSFDGLWSGSKPIKGILKFYQNNTTIQFADYDKGIAQIKYENKNFYKGQINIKNFLPSGNGIVKFHNGNIYDGDWLNGVIHGKGKFQWIKQQTKQTIDKYEGQYQFGKKHGFGRFSFNSGNLYEGYWVKGMMQGSGKWINSSGQQIEGIWKNGQYQGKQSKPDNTENILKINKQPIQKEKQQKIKI